MHQTIITLLNHRMYIRGRQQLSYCFPRIQRGARERKRNVEYD